jgi:hypothetical protein
MDVWGRMPVDGMSEGNISVGLGGLKVGCQNVGCQKGRMSESGTYVGPNVGYLR